MQECYSIMPPTTSSKCHQSWFPRLSTSVRQSEKKQAQGCMIVHSSPYSNRTESTVDNQQLKPYEGCRCIIIYWSADCKKLPLLARQGAVMGQQLVHPLGLHLIKLSTNSRIQLFIGCRKFGFGTPENRRSAQAGTCCSAGLCGPSSLATGQAFLKGF